MTSVAAAVSILILTSLASAPIQAESLPGHLAWNSTHAISRFAVTFDEQDKHNIRRLVINKGYRILSEGPGFFAVTHAGSLGVPTSNEAAAAAVAAPARRSAAETLLQQKIKARRKLIEKRQMQKQQEHLLNLQGIPGVHRSEQDVRRYLHIRPTLLATATPKARFRRKLAADLNSKLVASQTSASVTDASTTSASHLSGHWRSGISFRPSQFDIWATSVSDQQCASNDVQLADFAAAEMLPWGMTAIGARNKTLLSAQNKGRVIVCIIDSGFWANHPEFMQTVSGQKVQASGCKIGPNCPYEWSGDIVGHGTHVAGTIGAAENGVGVIGVMSSAADFHIVRIWNDSGDVSQGQGPYATDLILAYDNCLEHLAEQQKKNKTTRMVINMSYGSAGPLTAERLWIEKAARRGDVLFVGSAGNNGTFMFPPSAGRQETDPGQYMSYPASYNLQEVLSVANMHCDGTIDFSSQKNKMVSIAAPGMAILSSVPREYGAVRAYINTNKPLPNQTEPVEASTFSGYQSLTSSSTSSDRGKPITRSGLGFLLNGYREPRAVQGSRIGSSGMQSLAQCNADADIRARAYIPPPNQTPLKAQITACSGTKNNVCLIKLPGIIDWYHETCIAMLKCIQGGGKGLIIWRNGTAVTGGADSDYIMGFEPDEFLLGTQVNCGTRCACWIEMKRYLNCGGNDCASRVPPGIVVSMKHAQALMNANQAAGFRVNITVYEYDYRHFDGTSMAAPHVSGAAAQLWRLFPECEASEISQALKASAQKLPGQSHLAAGHGLLRVDLAYDWLLRNKCGLR